MRSKFARNICYFAFSFRGAGREKYWNVVMRGEPIRLAGDPAAAFCVSRRNWSEEREVIGLRQSPTAARNSAERHCSFFHAGIFVCKLGRLKFVFV